MTFLVGWGRSAGSAKVNTVAELDQILDNIDVPLGALPYSVSIVLPNHSDIPVLLEIGIGHPDRSFAYHVGADGSSAWAYQPDVTPIDGFVFDHGGAATDAWPERTRVTPAAARTAAREFVASRGARPPSLSWDTGE